MSGSSDREGESPPGPFLVVVLLVLAVLQYLLVLLAPGCASGPPRPEPAPPFRSSVAPCAEPLDPGPVDADVCEGESTPEGLQCVRCDVPRGCLLESAAVYCTPACSDPYCRDGGRRR